MPRWGRTEVIARTHEMRAAGRPRKQPCTEQQEEGRDEVRRALKYYSGCVGASVSAASAELSPSFSAVAEPLAWLVGGGLGGRGVEDLGRGGGEGGEMNARESCGPPDQAPSPISDPPHF